MQTSKLTYAEQKMHISKYVDVKGQTISYSLEHAFWIVDFGKGFYTIAASQHSMELAHPVKTVIFR